MNPSVSLHHGECLDVMSKLPDGSVDMVLCDLPYAVTACSWDTLIPFDKLWAAYKRIVKPRGAIVLTATSPFSHTLAVSNLEWLRHEWVWDKVQPVGFQIAKFRPMQRHETVLVFGQESPSYYPVVEKLPQPLVGGGAKVPSKVSPIAHDDGMQREYFYKYPQSILVGDDERTTGPDFDTREGGDVIRISKGGARHDHPSQKPVPLMAFFIQTYSRPGDVVLDNTMGSGSTGVAAVIEGRSFIGIEKDEKYFNVSKRRIEAESSGRPHLFGTDSVGVVISRVVPPDTSQPTMDMWE